MATKTRIWLPFRRHCGLTDGRVFISSATVFGREYSFIRDGQYVRIRRRILGVPVASARIRFQDLHHLHVREKGGGRWINEVYFQVLVESSDREFLIAQVPFGLLPHLLLYQIPFIGVWLRDGVFTEDWARTRAECVLAAIRRVGGMSPAEQEQTRVEWIEMRIRQRVSDTPGISHLALCSEITEAGELVETTIDDLVADETLRYETRNEVQRYYRR